MLSVQYRATLTYRKSVTTSPLISITGVKEGERPVSHSDLTIPRNNFDGIKQPIWCMHAPAERLIAYSV